MNPPLLTCPVARQGFLQAGHIDFSQWSSQSKPTTSAIKPKKTSVAIEVPSSLGRVARGLTTSPSRRRLQVLAENAWMPRSDAQ
jgi:hypothetical protein